MYTLEGLMSKLKLQYFGHLMRRADSLEKILKLGKIEGRRRRGRQRMGWLDGIADSMGMSLSKLLEMVKDREALFAAVHEAARCRTHLSRWTKNMYKCVYVYTYYLPSYVPPWLKKYFKRPVSRASLKKPLQQVQSISLYFCFPVTSSHCHDLVLTHWIPEATLWLELIKPGVKGYPTPARAPRLRSTGHRKSEKEEAENILPDIFQFTRADRTVKTGPSSLEYVGGCGAVGRGVWSA